MSEARYCEKCGKQMIEKTARDLFEAIEIYNAEKIPESVLRTFQAFRYVYNCGCPMNPYTIEHCRNKAWHKTEADKRYFETREKKNKIIESLADKSDDEIKQALYSDKIL